MNKKALEAAPSILALLAAGLAFWMGKRMDMGIVKLIITAVLTLVAGYFFTYWIANK